MWSSANNNSQQAWRASATGWAENVSCADLTLAVARSAVSLRLALGSETVPAVLRVQLQGLQHLELLLPGRGTTIPQAFSRLSALTSLICTNHTGSYVTTFFHAGCLPRGLRVLSASLATPTLLRAIAAATALERLQLVGE